MKYVLFDLDGTLLPMNQDIFVKSYFKELIKRISPLGYEPQAIINGVWNGMKQMVINNGLKTNEEVFWDSFCHDFGEDILQHKRDFDDFYKTDFHQVKKVCGFTPKAEETILMLRQMNIKTVVATLPVFPASAIEARIRWAGIDPNLIEFYTSYETSHFTKPNPAYYQELLNRLDADPEECLMVGNNVDEDMIAKTLGMSVFLLTDDLINEHDKNIAQYPNGSYDDLQAYITSVC